MAASLVTVVKKTHTAKMMTRASPYKQEKV